MSGRKPHLPAHRQRRIIALVLSAAALQGCATEWASRLYLPQGDADRGRQAVEDLKCQACHDVNGFDPPEHGAATLRVRLGGQTNRIKTYGDLVTSIVNPSHRIVRDYPRAAVTTDGASSMSLAHLNAVMTVQQLVDLVAFLQADYEVVPPPFMPPWETYPTSNPDGLIHPPSRDEPKE